MLEVSCEDVPCDARDDLADLPVSVTAAAELFHALLRRLGIESPYPCALKNFPPGLDLSCDQFVGGE